jgi:hypothetical protein
LTKTEAERSQGRPKRIVIRSNMGAAFDDGCFIRLRFRLEPRRDERAVVHGE